MARRRGSWKEKEKEEKTLLQPRRCSLPTLVVAPPDLVFAPSPARSLLSPHPRRCFPPPSSLRAKRSNLRGWAATQGFFQGVVLISFPEMMNRAQQAKLADRL